MKPVIQANLGDPANGALGGTCLRAAIASLLELDEADVPDFANEPGDDWFTHCQQWVHGRTGYWLTYIPITPLHAVPLDALPYEPPGWSLLSGFSSRETKHVVVCLDGQIVHDPHPSGNGLTKALGWWLFLPDALTFELNVRAERLP